VVQFIERCEDQLQYCPVHFWHVHVLQKAFGKKVTQMATVYQKGLLPGRFPARNIAGKMMEVPGKRYANWKELKEWLLREFAKPEQDLFKLEKIIKGNSQGNKSYGEYASNLTLELQQIQGLTTEMFLRALLLLGMRASTKKRLLVDPDLLNGSLVEWNRIVTKIDDVEYQTNKGNKSVGALAEERCTEISGTEEEKPAWQQRPARKVFAKPFTKVWYAECAEDTRDRPDCKFCGSPNHKITSCHVLADSKCKGEKWPDDVNAAKQLDKAKNFVPAGPGRRRYISILEIVQTPSIVKILEEEETVQPQAPVESEVSVTSATSESVDVKVVTTEAEDQEFRAREFSVLKDRLLSERGPVVQKPPHDISDSESDDEDDDFLECLMESDSLNSGESVQSIGGLLIMQPKPSALGGQRLFLSGSLGGVPAKIMIDSGAELNVVSGTWVSDNVESVKAWIQKCQKYWVRGISLVQKWKTITNYTEFPWKLEARGSRPLMTR
jgi:hypothetical protein